MIRLITLYWKEDPTEDGTKKGKNFSEEARKLRQFCEKHLGFEIESFDIPLENSQSELLGYINRTVSVVNRAKKEKECPALLIFHYGGHGDPNDQDPDDQRRGKAVWAQKERGGPTLLWGEIQETLSASEADILLVIDCCYAAHAARSSLAPRLPSRPKIQLLAACSEKTLGPGPKSFTRAFMNDLLVELQQHPQATIDKIHLRLCNRKDRLYSIPILVSLISDPNGENIRLHSLKPLHARSSRIF